jgi:hypothetical protein
MNFKRFKFDRGWSFNIFGSNTKWWMISRWDGIFSWA